ncbi:MAG: hypothetical protein H6738_00240 [Alphaproteobacteria bacterium]|nr:hypothetical protein [Alphaproteobacteria bacterium]MCB9695195.1 hypothetical protein [Alphaproteobacteria bacterium]
MLLALLPLVADAKKPALIEGTLAGRPFGAVSAMAVGDPGRPGTLFLMLADQPVACDAPPSDDATLLLLGFEPVTGGPTEGGLVLNKSRGAFGVVGAKGALLSVADAVGATGTVRIDAVTGEGNALSGTVVYTLCEVVKPLPPLSLTLEDRVVDTRREQGAPEVSVRAPVGWTEGYDQLGIHTWNAPDMRTSFAVQDTCNGTCDPALWEVNAARWQDDQAGAFDGVPGWTVQRGRNEVVAPGTRVVRTTLGAAGMPSMTTVAVLRYDPAWPTMFVCTLKTEAKHTEVLDAAEKACLTMSPK